MIALVENSASFPGYPSTLAGNQAGNLMLWSWPAYLNSVGCYWPNPNELPGQPGYAGSYPLPQFGTTPMQANPNLAQSYHPGAMNVSLMDGSVRTISQDITQSGDMDSRPQPGPRHASQSRLVTNRCCGHCGGYTLSASGYALKWHV